jgi:hypothetical protein
MRRLDLKEEEAMKLGWPAAWRETRHPVERLMWGNLTVTMAPTTAAWLR